MGLRVIPNSLNEYSTLGGISGNTFRTTIPCSSNSRSCCVNVFVVILPKNRCNSLKRIVPLYKCHNIFSFHFPLNMFNPTSTGHCSSTACDLAIIYYSFHSVKKDTLYQKSAYLPPRFVNALLIISNKSRRRKFESKLSNLPG